jgi:hypothetical protein
MDVCPEPISGSKQKQEQQYVRCRVDQALGERDQAAVTAVSCDACPHPVYLDRAWAYSLGGKVPTSAAKEIFTDLGDAHELALPQG